MDSAAASDADQIEEESDSISYTPLSFYTSSTVNHLVLMYKGKPLRKNFIPLSLYTTVHHPAPTCKRNNSSISIPDDLAFSILSKLPVKSLKRFACCHLPETPDCFCLTEFHLLHNKRKFNLPSPFPHSDGPNCILSSTSVNGIFCLGLNDREKVMYVLWNPLTEEFMVVPSSPAELIPKRPQSNFYQEHSFHGFGYDQLRDDFKLFAGLEVYLDGACHWLAWKSINNSALLTGLSLLSFDLGDEVFLTTPIGEESYTPYTYQARLAVLNGSIALISNYHDDTVFHISILGEIGVTQSWIKLYVSDPFPSLQWPLVGFGKNGCIFFTKKDSTQKDYELAYVDLSTQIIQDVGFTVGEGSTFITGLYKESLLSIGGSSH
ncbi:uncharacterized protein LOC131648505 [Vicia villosa]|uniref:uncharacterized protein LOC131648505 n=1 Tax=Vicia villosa TaxID=3911 RepID=UPI00273CC7E4|nr:uncharacterized protein LOC131648505 [Vicia villosa]